MNALTITVPSSRIIYVGLGLVLAVISGIALSNSGRPLNNGIFTFHKLIAVGTIILLGLSIKNLFKVVDFHALYLIVIMVTGLLFLTLVVSGALLSFDNLAVRSILRIHQIAPLLALLFLTLSIYLLLSSRS